MAHLDHLAPLPAPAADRIRPERLETRGRILCKKFQGRNVGVFLAKNNYINEKFAFLSLAINLN